MEFQLFHSELVSSVQKGLNAIQEKSIMLNIWKPGDREYAQDRRLLLKE